MYQYGNLIPYMGQNLWVNPSFVRPVMVPVAVVVPTVPSVNQMSVEQTAAWIQSLSYSKQWKQADEYAKSFFENKVNGLRLISLTIQSLATDLNIRKLGHRFDIIEAIRDLVKATGGGCANNETQFGGEPQYWSEEGAQTPSYKPTVKFEKNPQSSNNSSHAEGRHFLRPATPQEYHTTNRSFRSEARNLRSHQSNSSSQKLISTDDAKLVVTYNGSEEINHALRDHFRQFDFDVEVKPLEDSPFGYIILFKSAEEAESAFEKRRMFSYKLQKYSIARNVKDPGGALPTQEQPVSYKVLNRTTVRKGVEKTSNFVVDLLKGELVSVDKLHNNRARIVRKNREGIYQEFGWASLCTDCGHQLMIPFNF